jgi:hypothetical protein
MKHCRRRPGYGGAADRVAPPGAYDDAPADGAPLTGGPELAGEAFNVGGEGRSLRCTLRCDRRRRRGGDHRRHRQVVPGG